MSAIAGFSCRDGAPANPQDISRMLQALTRYGPEGETAWVGGPAALGHRWMLPSACGPAGPQPVPVANGRVQLVADVRLDNRDDLARSLRLQPNEAASLSDAECLGRAFERWGTACPEHILGDYSFAAWDQVDRSWFLARDAAGSLPLFYFSSATRFAFSSMPIGLFGLEDFSSAPNGEWIMQMLESVPRPTAEDVINSSFFRDIRRVPAGHSILVKATTLQIRRWWQPERTPLQLGRPEAYHEALREQLDLAVRRRLRGASTDVAAHLSGGLDSSSVAATAARLQGSRGAGVVAYTSVPNGPATQSARNRFADEREHAAATSAMYSNMEHVFMTSGGRAPWTSLPDAFALYQQPILNICNLPWMEAIYADASRRGLPILLSGVRGNHTISYTGLDMLPSLLQSANPRRWMTLLRLMRALHAQRGMAWKSLAARVLRPWLPSPLQRLVSLAQARVGTGSLARQSLLHPAKLAERAKLPTLLSSAHGADHVEGRIHALQQADHASFRKGVLAAYRIDDRDPTGDRQLMEFCLRVPVTEYLRGGMPSALIRDGLADRLPALVRREVRKGLQGVDWHVGAACDLVSMQRLSEKFADSEAVREYLNVQKLQSMLQNWPKDGWDDEQQTRSYRHSLLRAISVAGFLYEADRAR